MPRQSLSASTVTSAETGRSGARAANVSASTRAPSGLCATSNTWRPTRWKRPGSRTRRSAAATSVPAVDQPPPAASSIVSAVATLCAWKRPSSGVTSSYVPPRAGEPERGAVGGDAHVADPRLLRHDAHRRRSHGVRLSREAGADLGIQVADHGRRARLEDPALLGRDQRARVAEQLHVIEPDRRHARHDGLHDVRRVEPPAEPRLDDRDVRTRAREVVERQRGRDLEERRAERLGDRRPAPHEVDDRRLLDRRPSTTMRSRKSTRCGDV